MDCSSGFSGLSPGVMGTCLMPLYLGPSTESPGTNYFRHELLSWCHLVATHQLTRLLTKLCTCPEMAGRPASLNGFLVSRMGLCIGDIGSHLYGTSRWLDRVLGRLSRLLKIGPTIVIPVAHLPSFRFWWFFPHFGKFSTFTWYEFIEHLYAGNSTICSGHEGLSKKAAWSRQGLSWVLKDI